MTIYETLTAIINSGIFSNVIVMVTFGSYIGTRYIALRGTPTQVEEKLNLYPELGETTLDPNGVKISNNSIELFATLYKGENVTGHPFEITSPEYEGDMYFYGPGWTVEKVAEKLNIDTECVYMRRIDRENIHKKWMSAKQLFGEQKV